MSRDPTSPRRRRKQRDRTVGRRRASWSAHRTMVTPAGGSSRVLSSADWASSFIRSAASMMATRAATLDGHEDEVGEEVLDAPVARLRAADHDLAPRPGGPEAMHVGVRAVLDQPARPAHAARPGGRLRRAQEAGGQVEREGRLADALGPGQEHGVRGRPVDHRGHRGERGSLAPGPRPVHPRSLPDQAGSVAAVFRGARRFGGASVAAVVGRGHRVRGSLRLPRGARLGGRRRRRAPSSVTSPSTAVAAAALEAADVRDAAGFRVARGLAGAASSPGTRLDRGRGGRRSGLARGTRLG